MSADYGVDAGLVAGAALWLGNAGHDLSGMLAATGPGDFAAGAAGRWTTHIYSSVQQLGELLSDMRS